MEEQNEARMHDTGRGLELAGELQAAGKNESAGNVIAAVLVRAPEDADALALQASLGA